MKKFLITFWDLLVLIALFKIADVGLLTLILTLIAVIFTWGLKVDLKQSLSFRAFLKLWSLWNRSLAYRNGFWALIAGAFLSGAIQFWASFRRHAAFESHAFDLGIFTNALWNLTHQAGLYSSVKGGMPLLADHQSPLLFVLSPAFALISSPLTLLGIQAFGLALGAIPLYWIGRQFQKSSQSSDGAWIAATLPLIYWAYLPTRYAAQFDFHPEVLILPLFLAAIACFQWSSKKIRVWGVLFFCLGLMGKESAGPLAVGIGLAWLFGAGPQATQSFTRRWSWVFILVGLLVFYFDLKIVPHWVGAPGYAYAGLYSQYGRTFSEILLAPFLKTRLLLEQLFGPTRWVFLFWTLAPLGFAPIFNFRAIPAFLPGYLMLFLSLGEHRVDVRWHYGIEPAVGLFFALPWVLFQWTKSRYRRLVPFYVIFAVMATFTKSEIYKGWKYQQSEHMRWLSSEFLPRVDKSVSLAVTEALVPHLSTRHWVERLDYLLVPTEETPSCVIYDSSLSNWPMQENRTKELLGLPPWKSVYHCDALEVWERESSAAASVKCLTSTPDCPTLGK